MQLTQTLLTALVAAALVIGAGYAVSRFTPRHAFAGAPEKTQGFGPGWRHDRHGTHMGLFCNRESPARLSALTRHAAARLDLTAGQKLAWNNLIQAIESSDDILRATCNRLDAAGDGTAPDQLARAEAMMETGLDALRVVRPAFETLYARLDTTQRKTLDGLFDHGGKRH